MSAHVLDGDSLNKMSAEMGLTPQRLGQIERRAFAKIRKIVYETNDFPLIREFFEAELSSRVQEDKLKHEAKLMYWAKQRTQKRNAKQLRP